MNAHRAHSHATRRKPPAFAAREVRLPAESLAHSLCLAAQCVQGVRTGKTLPAMMTELQQQARSAWAASTRGAVRDLAANALRDYARGDALIARFVQKPLPELLHCALLCAIPRLWSAPEHAYTTVHQTVTLAEALLPPVKGVVNAVLRRVQREEAELRAWLDEAETTRYAFPQWWIDTLRADHPERWQAILAACQGKPPMSLRINRRKTDETAACAALEEAGMTHERQPNGAILLHEPRPVERIPHFFDGWFSVQDAGAQYAAQLLDVHDGQRVLDACAAPGGKAAHLLERADIHLTALEADAARAEVIAPQFDRLGLRAEKILTADARRPETWWDGQPFARILADVPCSASGVVRRNPDSKWLRRADDLRNFTAQQAAILRALWRTLASGGKLLYATCSLFACENRAQIEDFCRNHRDAVQLPLEGFPAADGQLFPATGQDGFFYALLQKA